MAEETPLPEDIAAMGFEDALAELETIVRKLEEGNVKLEQAIQAYERGAHLKRHCENKLAEARGKIDRIAIQPDGSVTTEPQQETE